ncbi:MAG TPA: hypothetical protein VGK54_14010, partial [Chloroflexota bacterium]
MAVAVDAGKYGLSVGKPGLKSAGAITFGPDGILFVADNVSAKIFAIDVADAGAAAQTHEVNVENLDTRLAAYLGCSRDDIHVRDLAVHPDSETVYLSVMRGTGESAIPLLLTVGADGKLAEVPLANVHFSEIAISNAPAINDEREVSQVVAPSSTEGEEREMPNGHKLRIARLPLRTATVTDIAYVDGTLLVAGASNEEFSSALRRIPFPFTSDARSNSLEIFHVSHGRYETAAPIRTFLPYAGNTSVVASYTCTPVVHFSLSDFQPGTQVKGRTVADLGAGNTPIDLVAFKRDGEEYLLISNTRHPLLKIASKDIDKQEGLT